MGCHLEKALCGEFGLEPVALYLNSQPVSSAAQLSSAEGQPLFSLWGVGASYLNHAVADNSRLSFPRQGHW